MEFECFDDLDTMFDAMRDASRKADARVKPWQRDVKPGDYFQRDSGLGFPIYGQIVREEERRPNHLRHYRLCRAYSAACPEGELGDIHVSTIEDLISKGTFDEARERGWWPDDEI